MAAPLILASRSPRRAELLRDAGISFTQDCFPDVDESIPARPDGSMPPVAEIVRALAARKAVAALPLAPSGARVLCADTLVALDGEILGKPADAADACVMLAQLSGQTHVVATGVIMARAGRSRPQLAGGTAETRVRFRSLSEQEIEAYVATGEPLDKAGAYAIQGDAGAFVESLDGDLDTVIGLPIRLVRRLLAL